MALVQLTRKWLKILSDDPAHTDPAGDEEILRKDTEYTVVHKLGGDFTIRSRHGTIYRIEGMHAAALGEEVPGPAVLLASEFSEEALQQQLKKVYDPEIPVDIVEMGLVYKTEHSLLPSGGHRVDITMTLTAPGCGMGQVLVDDVRRKVGRLPGVEEVDVKIVFDPPWNSSMMSEVAMLQAGLL